MKEEKNTYRAERLLDREYETWNREFSVKSNPIDEDDGSWWNDEK